MSLSASLNDYKWRTKTVDSFFSFIASVNVLMLPAAENDFLERINNDINVLYLQ